MATTVNSTPYPNPTFAGDRSPSDTEMRVMNSANPGIASINTTAITEMAAPSPEPKIKPNLTAADLTSSGPRRSRAVSQAQ